MTFDFDFYDAELRRYNERFIVAVDVQAGNHVLDIGCGTGQTTRQAARSAGPGGSALGVDVSAARLDMARRLVKEERLDNVSFRCANAQTDPFPDSGFDICISRFGTMFFTDPVAAFTNLGRALRPGARLVMLVWQRRDRNEWATAIDEALSADSPAPSETALNPFSLADPTTAHEILAAAGFSNVQLADVREPVYYGPDVDNAYAAVLELWNVETRLADLDAITADRTHSRLLAAIEAHDTEAGVLFDSRAWIVSAVNRKQRNA